MNKQKIFLIELQDDSTVEQIHNIIAEFVGEKHEDLNVLLEKAKEKYDGNIVCLNKKYNQALVDALLEKVSKTVENFGILIENNGEHKYNELQVEEMSSDLVERFLNDHGYFEFTFAKSMV